METALANRGDGRGDGVGGGIRQIGGRSRSESARHRRDIRSDGVVRADTYAGTSHKQSRAVDVALDVAPPHG